MVDAGTLLKPREDLIEFVAAYIRFAEESASQVAAFLRQWQKTLGRSRKIEFPQGFLCELGAIIRIAHWQQSQALAPLAAEFLPAKELFARLLEQFIADCLRLHEVVANSSQFSAEMNQSSECDD
jgi:hypothetical protein